MFDFWGNDIAIADYKNQACLVQKTICCSSSNNDCNIKKNLNINNQELNKKSMFLMKNRNENEVAQLLFTDVYFLNFYAVKEEIGWRSLIFSNNTSKIIQFCNVTFFKKFFSHGLLYDLNSPTILSQNLNNITLKNIYIGNFSSISFQFQNNSFSSFKHGLFSFINSSYLLIGISNLTISYITIIPSDSNQYVLLFEGVLYSYFTLNGLLFDNNINLGFYTANGSIRNIINDFTFKNIAYSQALS